MTCRAEVSVRFADRIFGGDLTGTQHADLPFDASNDRERQKLEEAGHDFMKATS
jgi:hypothetical protein